MLKIFWPFLAITAVLVAAISIGFHSASKTVPDPAPAAGAGPASHDSSIGQPLPPSNVAPASIPEPATAPPPTDDTAPMPRAMPASQAAPAPPVTTLAALYRTYEAIDTAADAATPESLAVLINYASTDNADIRSAAINALIRRGDADAAPFLRTAAKQTDSSEAAIALLKTADYLELPVATMHEIYARRRSSAKNPPAGTTR